MAAIGDYLISKRGSLGSLFTPDIVKDVLRHMETVLNSGGRLRTVNKREGLSKAIHGAKIALGKTDSTKDLYLWHPRWTITNGVYTDYISIHDLVPGPGIPKWQVIYRLLLLGKDSDYASGADRLGGARLGVANEVTVDIRGTQVVVDFEVSGMGLARVFEATAKNLGFRVWPVFKQQMQEKWGCCGILFGAPGSDKKKTKKNEGFEYVRRVNGRQVAHTGGPEGEWIGIASAF